MPDDNLPDRDAGGLEAMSAVAAAGPDASLPAAPPASVAAASGGWEPHEVWRTRVRDPRRTLNRTRRR